MQILFASPALFQARSDAGGGRSRVASRSAPESLVFGRDQSVVAVPRSRHQDEFKKGKASALWRLRWRIQPARRQVNQGPGWPVFASQAQTAQKNVKWILESVGDGDCGHLGADVPLPGSFELASESATVGRGGGKADILLGVATVSSMHARFEKRGGALYVTDLDSTNGTYIDGKRLRPGAVTPVLPGSIIVFGDEHLAVFRVEQEEDTEQETQAVEAQEDSQSE